ncbi:unnamed protein product, partial [Mesorhabditis belari]|uniref:Uncharacterized protein n=1 Tax=Mesorhabditis belari TaxID=2138241 RepID=A0AAF3J701_9BILA
MYSQLLSCLTFALFLMEISCSPVQVTILTDTAKEGLHLGPYDRTRFDLIESYNPLATAGFAKRVDTSNFKAKSVASRAKASGVRNIFSAVGEDSDLLGNTVEAFEHQTPGQSINEDGAVLGEYLEWGSWSNCVNGQRYRTRACVSRRAARRIRCDGAAKETQTCFSVEESNVRVASDPWTIEREISGQMMKLKRPFTLPYARVLPTRHTSEV